MVSSPWGQSFGLVPCDGWGPGCPEGPAQSLPTSSVTLWQKLSAQLRGRPLGATLSTICPRLCSPWDLEMCLISMEIFLLLENDANGGMLSEGVAALWAHSVSAVQRPVPPD